ncbi:hypothetical protein LF1_55920 [Rubripirellula obstinata]|uniref:Uncharacterized protein n=1 Tax=Rubripirellula obstinata TaxID=406547 RepID=A0A5B1CA90_9BACT|nr:hypothetical protein [Rubripirellula obstinata]KAA1257192.1 hypothetical protein LF1_55920 [Rubripirellula obstinata]
MTQRTRLTAYGVIGIATVTCLAVARQRWTSGFANNADADALRFYSALGIGVLALFPISCLYSALNRR